MTLVLVRIATVLLQIITGILALQLIKLTRKKIVWIWIASAIFLTAFERSFTYYQILGAEDIGGYELVAEHVAFYIAFLMLMGVAGLHALFRRMEESNQRVRESEEKYRTLLENLPQCIYLKNRDMIYSSCNENFARDVGISPSEIQGKTDFDIFAPDAAKSNHELDLRAFQKGEIVESETSTERGGEGFFFRSVKTPVKDENGEKTGLLVIYSDITAQKKAQIEHEELQKKMIQTQKLESLGVLAGGIAHDFNNLLTGILGNAYLMLDDLEQNTEMYESVEAIQSSANRAADLTSQMLAYSGQGQYMAMRLDLAEEIEKFEDLLKSSISKKSHLDIQVADDLPRLKADPAQLRQILLNLVTNASEALDDESGVIKIIVGLKSYGMDDIGKSVVNSDELKPGEYVFVRVEDTGCGFEAKDTGRLFEPFFTTKFTGRGLGLSAVLGIVRASDGGILVESEMGVGSCFEILLPNLGTESFAEDARELDASEDSPVLQGSGIVLIVDDERVVREVAKRLLEIAGFKVLIASNGGEAVKIYQEKHESIACVLLDMTMPVMNGRETHDRLNEINPDVKIIVSSGYSESEIMPLFKDKHTVAFVQKPYNFKKLYDAIGVASS